jgi:hypothetical protein
VTALIDERQQAIRAVDTACPRCGAARAPDQAYCVECGAALPRVTGRLPALRRRWIRRLGWYPGDWVWLALLALPIAAAGAAAAIVVAHHRAAGGPHVITAISPVAVAEPTAVASTEARISTLPTPPEPTTTTGAPPNGRQAWPAGTSGWTIVLVSYPKTTGRRAARETAAKAAKAGLPQVGVLDSSLYASLQPGYDVVFSGIYGSQAEANAAVAAAHQAGFGAAYSRQIAS